MRINNNLMAMNTHRQLGAANAGGAKSMEKLSSGMRINRAGDDAAGLSISEKMRGQIRGLNQASANAQDGISLIQTAEGALNETQAILQRMRELSVQSSSDTNVDELDREAIQNEFKQLKEEIDRIGETTEFNTKKLLKGDGSAAKEMGALKLGKTGGIELASLAAGKVTEAKGANMQVSLVGVEGADELKDKSFTFKFNGESIKVNFETVATASEEKANSIDVKDNGNEVTITLVDGNTNQDFIMSKVQEGLEEAMKSNSNIDESNFTLSRDKSVVSINSVAKGEGQSVSVVDTSTVANTALSVGKDGGTLAAVDTTAAEATGTAEVRTRASVVIKDIIDPAKFKTQVLESGISVGNTDYFTVAGALTEDGAIKFLTDKGLTIGDETIEFFDSNKGKYEGSADFAVDLALVDLGASTAVDAAGLAKLVSGIVDQVGNKMKDVTLSVDATGLKVTAKEPGVAGNSIEIKDGADRAATDVVGSKFEAQFQIGANEGQNMDIKITDMRSEALGLKNVDLGNREDSKTAITTINDAINKVSNQRSELGAFQNRLEHTIKNLDNSAENLQAAEARIRDVDMAKEMMTQTKNSILSQAATAMLAQAKNSPEAVLQLLR